MKATYEPQWREYRKRRTILLIILATYIPGVFLFALLLQRLLRSDTATSIVAFRLDIGIWSRSVASQHMALSEVRKVVSCEMATGNPLTGRCLHCGLPKWADRGTTKHDELPSDQFHCFQCGNVISKGDSTCAKCGWSWKDSGVQQAGGGERE